MLLGSYAFGVQAGLRLADLEEPEQSKTLTCEFSVGFRGLGFRGLGV